MNIWQKALLVIVLGILLYGGIYMYALHSEGFQFVQRTLESSPAIAEKVGVNARVNLSLFDAFKEKHVDSDQIVNMKVTVAGSIGSIPIDVKAVRKDGTWKIESASTNGAAIDLDKHVQGQ